MNTMVSTNRPMVIKVKDARFLFDEITKVAGREEYLFCEVGDGGQTLALCHPHGIESARLFFGGSEWAADSDSSVSDFLRLSCKLKQ